MKKINNLHLMPWRQNSNNHSAISSHHPVNMSHSLFISNLPWKKEIEAEELQKTLENAGIHGVILVKIGEYMD